ncbi:uncharacterized protein LTR77_003856 [Saxophila tyrrhenica]|uniref:PWWP domain-containing protein n=1 Tax=Saxophila tyrrhenica TaxID=1690608 RepID=A0AAV9PF08_9PEZI|nr:hypothetical protein LTR77_003856 [Saxophila tyrrhenica]
MVDEPTTSPPVEAPAPATEAPTEPTPAADTNGDASAVSKDVEDTAGKQATTEATAPDGVETAEVAQAEPAAAPEAAAAPSNKKEKRKSSGAVPEHKNKKLNKKKSMPTLHLNCQPGDFYWAKLKGYPPWPSVICDEQMLPESLLATRPVSTTRPDGSIRDDFKEGGKNSKERTYPVMFLSTNEFTWMINTNLEPLEPEECKTLPKSKMIKSLQDAWKIASENHDLAYFKGILKTWQEEEAKIEQEMREEAARAAEEEAARKEREAVDAEAAATEEAQAKKSKKSRKSKGSEDDVDMVDADGTKSAKKRKKDAESDSEGKPKKTPKVTKLNAPKTPNGEASTKKSAAKSKKKVVQAPKEDEEVQKEQLTAEQEREHREKAILYLRHRLQKGFLSRDVTPKEDEMDGMATFFSQLEAHENLEASIIRTTKIHKVLKGIVKLSSIPKDEEYNFKKRSASLLDIWNRRMAADGDVAPPSAVEPKESVEPAAEVKAESAVPETNGESAAAEAPKSEDEAKKGAQETETKADEAAKELDAKVEEVADAKVEEPVIAPAETKEAVDVEDVEMGEAAPEESAPKVEAAAQDESATKEEPLTSDAAAADAP